jgi:hypothetical protein
MKRAYVLACAVLLVVACGGSSGGGGSASNTPKETSAKTVASDPSDFSGMTMCPESGSWDDYLKAEQTADPTQFTSDKQDWENLKAGGANDSYIAVYADSSSNCGHFGTDQPTGKTANVYVIRFKDASSASASYKGLSKDFNITDTQLQQIQSAGGKVKQGAASGLGDNSMVVEFALAGTSFYIAFWQKNKFEVAMILFNMPVADGEAVASKVNSRIT